MPAEMPPVTSLAFDAVCGMWLEPSQVVTTYTYLGQTYAFCCAECCRLSAEDPDIHIILLAHEPGQSMGHRCPSQRRALASQQRGAKDLEGKSE